MRLLDRNSRAVSLTAAGEVLLSEARAALDAVTAAAHRTQRVGRPHPGLALVLSPGSDQGLLRDILAVYERDPAAIPVEVIAATSGRLAMIRDGRADIGFVYLPAASDLGGLDTEELLTERPMAVLSRQHRLAGRPSVRLADLRGEPVARWPGVPADRWPGPPPDAATGPEVSDPGELMQLIALGRAIAVEPESVIGPLRDDLVSIPVTDAPVSTVAIAWPEHSTSRAIAALVRAAASIAHGPSRATPRAAGTAQGR